MNIKDKVIAVTGSAQGLGRAMAVEFAKKGAKLALIDLNEDKLKQTKSFCEEAGGSADYYLADISKEDQVENLFSKIYSDNGRLDGLVNNAGILRDALLIKIKEGAVEKKLSLKDWQDLINVNLTGVFLCAREASIKMAQAGNGGVIVNISSVSRAGNMGQTNYSAAKAGVVSMTVVWAKELARYGIRVGAVAPGFIKTEMTAGMRPEMLDKMTSVIPLKRLGLPEEIADSVIYIFENDYFTGRVIECDGGVRL
jgi:3-oxoacyl-[acyl-carrier protein] reductase